MADMRRLPKGTKMQVANQIRDTACQMLGIENIISELAIRHLSLSYPDEHHAKVYLDIDAVIDLEKIVQLQNELRV